MKKLILILAIILNSSILFAQSNPQAPQKNDSTFLSKPTTTSKSDLKIIEGTSMIASYSITGNVERSKDLSHFFNIVQLSNLNETLRSRGPITVLVPDDTAFDSLPAGKMDTLLQTEHKYDLIALVTYHVIPGKLTAKNISRQISSGHGKATFTTLTGSILTAKIDENRNIILVDENGRECTIKRFDIQQINGIIHIVNTVLIPKFKAI